MIRQTPIAITGVGTRLPGVSSLGDMTRLLKSGQSTIAPIPESRWALSAANEGIETGLQNEHAALVEGFEGLDRKCFRISSNEAPMVDPLQRLFLETCWHALEDAGMSPAELEERPVGVFAGVSQSEYALLQAQSQFPAARNPYMNTGCSASVVPGRVAYCLGLTGPVQAIDNACASALSAVASACDALMTGRCSIALAGGAHVILSKMVMQSLTGMGVLSQTGQHRCFDKLADGFVRGEGCGVVVLKPLDAALADNDRIHAVINGWGQRHNGRTNGLSAPSRSAQAASMTSVMQLAGVSPEQVGFVEAHGSGTSLGDVMEAGAIQDALPQLSGQQVSVGSAKAFFGHLEAAAGMAGLIKTTAMLRDGFIPPQAGFSEMNQQVARVAPDVAVETAYRDWKTPDRKAIVASLGYNGACVHIMVSNGPQKQPDAPKGPGLFLISAASPAALTARLKQLQTLLETAPRHVTIESVAGAVSRRWSGMAYRVSFFGNSRDEVLRQIAECLASPGRLETRARKEATFGTNSEQQDWTGIIERLPAPWTSMTIKDVFENLGLPRPEAAGEIVVAPMVGTNETTELGLVGSDDPLADMYRLSGQLWERGVPLDTGRLWPCGTGGSPLDVPGYPFQRTHAWNLPQDASIKH